jgi:hypothetical protein
VRDFVVSGPCGEAALLRHVRRSARPDVVRIDLAALSFCEPLGLVAIAAFADGAREHADVRVVAPRDASVARYLSRMRLDQALDDLGVRHDLPAVREHSHDDVLLELAAFTSAADVDQLAGIVHRAVEPAAPEAASALHDCVVETGDNVPRHARRARGYLAAQKVRQGRDLMFAVADAGVGVLATLRGRGARDAASALRLAVQDGVTETPGCSSGSGLPEVVRHLSALRGHLCLVSGDAALTVSTRCQRVDRWAEPLPGTVLQGFVPGS